MAIERALRLYRGGTVDLYGAADQDGVRSLAVAVREALPPSRVALAEQAARWVDPTMLLWLLNLPIYEGHEQVRLSDRYVIHRLGSPFWCGNIPDGKGGAQMPLEEAVAKYWDEESGEWKYPKPCSTCFASGLLMARRSDEE